jgi:hypothetical protein
MGICHSKIQPTNIQEPDFDLFIDDYISHIKDMKLLTKGMIFVIQNMSDENKFKIILTYNDLITHVNNNF